MLALPISMNASSFHWRLAHHEHEGLAQHSADVGELEFNALVRLLERKDPSFRD